MGTSPVSDLQAIKVGSTDGIVINVAEGLKPGDKVAINVPNEVTDGSVIRPALVVAR